MPNAKTATSRITPADLPHQRVGEHASLFLAADYLHKAKRADPRHVGMYEQQEDEQKRKYFPIGSNGKKNRDDGDKKKAEESTSKRKRLQDQDDSDDNEDHLHQVPHKTISILDASAPSDRVLVINVGGTLGMCPRESDGRLYPKPHYLLEQLLNLPELRYPEVPVFDFIEYNNLVDSSDMSAAQWERLAKDIAEFYDQYSGFLIAHGTDTLHYTATALCFALEQLAKPVVIMGSMIPLCELYTDTRRNVTAALRFAGSAAWLEPKVYVFFYELLLYAPRVVKLNDSLRAFESPNAPAAADLNTLRFAKERRLFSPMDTHTVVGTLSATAHIHAPLQLCASFSDRVLCLPVLPDLKLSDASKIFSVHSRQRHTMPLAVILKVPEMNFKGSSLLSISLQKFGAAAASAGCAVFATSNCTENGLSPSTITCLLTKVPDVVPLNDMLAEAAVVKAMWLLGQYQVKTEQLTLEKFRRLMFVNLRGEVTPTVKSMPRPLWASRL